MRIHVISIGGRIMHTLAILLKNEGHVVSGSDDEIYEPSRSKLKSEKLLPDNMGWDPNRVNDEIDLVILGMHAKSDNPELLVAQKMGLKIWSYPEYIYNFSKFKTRVVIAGSHGKTTTTAMILHVLKYRNFDFDFLVGAELYGFDSMISLSDSPLIIIEGDEYLSSCIDRRPKMDHYDPDISVITGISWDHINVFRTEEEYDGLFSNYIDSSKKEAKFFLYEEDEKLVGIGNSRKNERNISFYSPLELNNNNVVYEKKQYRINVFGKHNRANMMAALLVCKELGITAADFFAAISTFKGASKRLELLFENSHSKLYRDFAHAPSKVKATVEAVREMFPDKKLVCFLELHTFSSLNMNFIPKYESSLDAADESYVFFSKHAMKIKGMDQLDPNMVRLSFKSNKLEVINKVETLEDVLKHLEIDNCIVLLMSSGTFEQVDLGSIFGPKF